MITKKKIKNVIEKIISFMDKEVKTYNYLPNNFMFIFSIIKNNTFTTESDSSIQQYWVNKFKSIETK